MSQAKALAWEQKVSAAEARTVVEEKQRELEQLRAEVEGLQRAESSLVTELEMNKAQLVDAKRGSATSGHSLAPISSTQVCERPKSPRYSQLASMRVYMCACRLNSHAYAAHSWMPRIGHALLRAMAMGYLLFGPLPMAHSQ